MNMPMAQNNLGRMLAGVDPPAMSDRDGAEMARLVGSPVAFESIARRLFAMPDSHFARDGVDIARTRGNALTHQMRG